MTEWILGRNPVSEALRANRRRFFRLWVAEKADQKRHLKDALDMARQRGIPVEFLPRQRLDALGENHQSVALEASAYPYASLLDILSRAQQRNQAPFILILDTVQDTHNLGALLRTAEAVGVHGVLLPLRRTATVTPAVVNTSSGACEHLLVAQTNLAQAISALKNENVWVYGLEGSEEAQSIETIKLSGATALVVGNEGSGLRSLVRQSCDVLVKLPMRGHIDSLNAAVAGSVGLYFIWQARKFSSETIDDTFNS
ncbi:MAG: 23S rRNA (guanosine(2251)-2'-O)-methyltransferase RlmB [Anaerolineae bacterium]|nr:23S rRNA (guanosine(2251)-2'-O)-methyltransferase RlmB [Anaerolineae bacterium]